jgi:branched-chain amino acid transport system substrate-binding protein
MMRVRRVGPFLAAIGCATALAACGSSSGSGGSSRSGTSSGSSGSSSGGTVKIAAIDWAEGAVVDLGNDEYNGIKLAVDQANAAGGVLGKKIKLNRYDEGYAASTFIPSARKAISDGNAVIIGGQEDAACQGIVQVAKSEHEPVIASVCGSTGDTMNGDTSAILGRIPANGGLVAMAKFMISKGYSKVQMLGAASSFDQQTAATFSAVFKKYGPSVDFPAPIYAPFSQPNNQSLVTKAVSDSPKMLYLGVFGQPIVDNAISDARSAGYKGAILVNEAAFEQPEANALGKAGWGVYGSTGWVPDPKVASDVKFVKDYRDAFHSTPEWLAENGYTEAQVAIAAMKAAHSTDPKVFGPYLRKVKIDDVDGTPVSFDSTGNRIGKYWYLEQDRHGKIVIGAKLPLQCQNTCPKGFLGR